MTAPVTLTLSRDEAIVLFDWLARFNSQTREASERRAVEDQAEQRVLWDLEASLESILEEPLRADYREILAAARARVRDPRE